MLQILEDFVFNDIMSPTIAGFTEERKIDRQGLVVSCFHVDLDSN